MEAQAEDPLLRVSVLLRYVFQYLSRLPDREAVTPEMRPCPEKMNPSEGKNSTLAERGVLFFSYKKKPTEQPVGA